MPGPATSEAEVTNISAHGFWLLVDGRELFLPFDEFPWFNARAGGGDPPSRASGAQPPLLADTRRRPIDRLDRASGALPAYGEGLSVSALSRRAEPGRPLS
jgi:hypothetical protein